MPGKLLITGGTGDLGSHLVRLAIKSGQWDEVHSTYHTLNPNFHKVFWHFADARNPLMPVLSRVNPNCIIHTAAMSSPDECEKRKLDAWQINVKASVEIANFSKANSIRFIHISTDQVFDGEKGNYAENDEAKPVNFYGDTKLEVENEIRESAHPNYAVVRLGLLYGFNQNQRLNFFDTMYHALRNQQPIPLFPDQFRSMMNIANAADCLLELATNSYQGILHLAGPERISRYEFGVRLSRHLKLSDHVFVKTQMSEVPSMYRRPKDVTLNIDLAKGIFTTPIQTIDEGIRNIFSL
jgi:dTDP-4-dehydrorhamnose reductase